VKGAWLNRAPSLRWITVKPAWRSLPVFAAEHLCSDGAYQEDAQARINDYPATLDPDDDGIACEALPCRMAAVPAPAAPAPATVPATGVGMTSQAASRVP